MLLGRGDRIELDARGLVIPHPYAADPQSIHAGKQGRPGWIWVGVKFFDGTTGKVGVSGNCGQHSLVIGPSPEESGWVPGATRFAYWASKQIGDQVIEKFIPGWGQISVVDDLAGVISWLNDGQPAYVIVRSALCLSWQEDGTARLVVREGNPAVLTRQTGPGGQAVGASQAAGIDAGGAIITGAASTEELSRLDDLLDGINSAGAVASELEPFDPAQSPADSSEDLSSLQSDDTSATSAHTEIGMPASSSSPFDGYEDMPADFWDGDVPEPAYYEMGDFTIALEGSWEYIAETDDSYPLYMSEEAGMGIMIVRENWEFDECLELLDLEYGSTYDVGCGGKDAKWVQLLDGDAERGCLVYIAEPLSSGQQLILLFISTPELWNELTAANVLNMLQF
jgi:hypothetical protein